MTAIVLSIILALGLLAAPLVTTAQQATRVPRIGVLTRTTARGLDAFSQGLRELGYVEGHNLLIERPMLRALSSPLRLRTSWSASGWTSW